LTLPFIGREVVQLLYPPQQISVAGAEHIDLIYTGIYKVVLHGSVEGCVGAVQLAAYLPQLTGQFCKLLDR